MNTSPWSGLVLGIIVVLMVHLTAATNAGRMDEPWPALLANEPDVSDLRIAMLQDRANAALERLVQSAPAEQ